jgi:hypothetical protein
MIDHTASASPSSLGNSPRAPIEVKEEKKKVLFVDPPPIIEQSSESQGASLHSSMGFGKVTFKIPSDEDDIIE